MLPVLKPVSKCWQPYDMLPKPEDPDFVDQVTLKSSTCIWDTLHQGEHDNAGSRTKCCPSLRITTSWTR